MLSKTRIRIQEQNGFTLIELLVVILIIGILAAVAIPTFLNQRGKAYDSNAESQAKTAQIAEETYATNNGSYTAVVSNLTAIEPSLSDTSSATLSVNAAPTGDEYQVVSTAANTGDKFTLTETNAGSQLETCTAGTGGSGSPGTCPTNGIW